MLLAPEEFAHHEGLVLAERQQHGLIMRLLLRVLLHFPLVLTEEGGGAILQNIGVVHHTNMIWSSLAGSITWRLDDYSRLVRLVLSLEGESDNGCDTTDCLVTV